MCRYPVLGLCIVLFLIFSEEVRGQVNEDTPEQPLLGPQRIIPDQPFIGRFDEVPYKNYGITQYPLVPPFTSNLRHIYSALGDSLMYGTEAISWIERRGLGVQRGSTNLIEGAPHGQMGNSFTNLFNYVVVGTDGTDAWQAKFMYANELRSKFTPLTFKMSNMDGLRLDLGTGNDQFSALFSRIHAPIHSSGWGGDHLVKVKAVLLGAHYERKVGFLNFGSTFVNVHQYEPLMANSYQTLKGVPGAIQNAPALLAIRISDDSPQDGTGGPVLHDIKVYVNGLPHPELKPFIIRLNKRGEERQTYVQDLLRSGERKPLYPPGGDYQTINRGSPYNTYDPYIDFSSVDVDVYYRGYEFPFWIDHLYYRDFKLYGPDHVLNPGHDPAEEDITVHGEFAHELVEPSGDFGFATMADLPQVFNGKDYGILYVDLEPFQKLITSVRVDLTLANDYRVEVSEIDLAGQAPNLPKANYRDRYRYATFFRTVARASGNPQDGEMKTVRVKSGTPTGLSLYSANMYGVLKGFQINAEFARSSGFYQYVSGPPAPRAPLDALSVNAIDREEFPGERHTISDNAYYVTVQRDFRRFGVGAEYFSMGPLYSTEFRSYIGRDEVDLGGNPIAYNNTLIHRLVEDNDDNDRYPDSWYVNGAHRFQGQSDIDGIFPGLDEDHDGIPDTNRNFNTQPDYLEPFLMYMSDPQVYDYGLDLNHNDYIDVRENDWEADLPYDPNLRGLHIYGKYKPSKGTALTLGVMDAGQIAGGAPNDILYSRLSYDRRIPTLGRFFTELSVERVHDGVADPLSVYSDRVLTIAEQFQVGFPGLGRGVRLSFFREEPREDPLNYKNSTFTRLFIDARWWAVPHLSIGNKVKYEVNHQHGGELYDTTWQKGNRLSRWAMVHTVDYQWEVVPRIILSSGLKFRYLKEWQQNLRVPTTHERHVIPLVKLEYRLTGRTRFQFGLQGIGNLLPYAVTDLSHSEKNFRQRDAVLMMTNNSKYRGYVISTNAGINYRVKRFDGRDVGRTGDERFTAMFMNIILGFEDQ